MAFDPYSATGGSPEFRPGPPSSDPAHAAADATQAVAKALRAAFRGRGQVVADGSSVQLTVRTPVPDAEGGGERIFSADVALQVRERAPALVLVPRIFAEVSRHEAGAAWVRVEPDTTGLLALFLEEVQGVLTSVASA